MEDYYQIMKILGQKVKFRFLTGGETALYQAMHDCKDFNEKDFKELLEFAKTRSIDTRYEYNKILIAIAMIKSFLKVNNNKLKNMAEKAFKISGWYALDLLTAASSIGYLEARTDLIDNKERIK